MGYLIDNIITFLSDFSFSFLSIIIFLIIYRYSDWGKSNKLWILFFNLILIITINVFIYYIKEAHLYGVLFKVIPMVVILSWMFWDKEDATQPYIFEKYHWYNSNSKEIGHTNDVPDIKKVIKTKIIKHYDRASMKHDNLVGFKKNIKEYTELLKYIFNKNKLETTKGIYIEEIKLLSKQNYLDSFHFELKLKIEMKLNFEDMKIFTEDKYNEYISNAILVMYKDVKRTKMLNRNKIIFKSTNRSSKCRSTYNRKIKINSKTKQFFILNCFIEMNSNHNNTYKKRTKSTYFPIN